MERARQDFQGGFAVAEVAFYRLQAQCSTAATLGNAMYISRGFDPATTGPLKSGTASSITPSHQDDLSQLQRLIDRTTANGRLDRQDEQTILAALAKTPSYSVEKCELFRQLQERVWQAELYLEW